MNINHQNDETTLPTPVDPFEKSFQRVNLISQIPIELALKDKKQSKKSLFDRKYASTVRPVSSLGQMSVQREYQPKRYKPIKVQTPTHKKLEIFEKSSQRYPEPGTYFPNYKIRYPSPILVDLHKDKQQKPRELQNATLAAIVHECDVNLRNFDPKKVTGISQNFVPDDTKISPPKIVINFTSQSSRDCFFTERDITANIEPLTHYPPENVPTVSFEHQSFRVIPHPVDNQLDYPKAQTQFDLLHQPQKIPRMKLQSGREANGVVNDKKEFLTKVKKRQKKMLKSFSHLRYSTLPSQRKNFKKKKFFKKSIKPEYDEKDISNQTNLDQIE